MKLFEEHGHENADVYNDGKWRQLQLDMSVTVDIKTGTRRLMAFFLALLRGGSEGSVKIIKRNVK